MVQGSWFRVQGSGFMVFIKHYALSIMHYLLFPFFKDDLLAISVADGTEELGKLWKQRFVEGARAFQQAILDVNGVAHNL